MKPPTPKSDRPGPGAAGDTQVIDLQDVELLVAAQSEGALQAGEHQRTLPPPLPPEVRASHVPSEPPGVSQPPASPSFYPQAPPPAPPRSTGFYLVALLAFLVVGVGGGVVVAMTLRKAPPAPGRERAPEAKPQAAVITIPVVEVNDDPDSGK
jgi:hypothetical protein